MINYLSKIGLFLCPMYRIPWMEVLRKNVSVISAISFWFKILFWLLAYISLSETRFRDKHLFLFIALLYCIWKIFEQNVVDYRQSYGKRSCARTNNMIVYKLYIDFPYLWSNSRTRAYLNFAYMSMTSRGL